MSFKVFCTAPIGRFLPDLNIPNNIELKVNEYATGKELLSGLKWCNRHISNARVVLDNDLLDRSGNVSMIYQPSIGSDNIAFNDLNVNVKVSGLWEEVDFRHSRLTTAELTLTLILSHLKNITQLIRDVKNSGMWDNRPYYIRDLADLNVGIVGFGCVGQGLAKLISPFGSKIFATDPFIDKDMFREAPVRFRNFKELLKCCDIISFHTPLNNSTQKMLGTKEINECKERPLIVNCARGGIVNESAIIDALKSNKICGYVCDVLEGENPAGVGGNQLLKFSKNDNRVLISPHVGGSSFNYMRDIFQIALDRVASA
ncbi:hypothetical protein OA410_02160 [Paracoccaceae bacterium]|nr:hypothetical protein [Paracoccaceae bacterium]